MAINEYSCVACATVCLTVMPSFSNLTDVSTIGHSFKIDSRRTPIFHVSQYGHDIIGRELNLDENCSLIIDSQDIKGDGYIYNDPSSSPQHDAMF